MKDVVECENLRRVLKQALTRRSPNGETHPLYADILIPSSLILRSGREVSELKYLSSWRQEIKRDSLSSDERNGTSPNHLCGVVGLQNFLFCIVEAFGKKRHRA